MNNWMRLCAWLGLGMALLCSMGCYSFETSYTSLKKIPWEEPEQPGQDSNIELSSKEVQFMGRAWATSPRNSRPYSIVVAWAPKQVLRKVSRGREGRERGRETVRREVELIGKDCSVLGGYEANLQSDPFDYIVGDVLMGKIWLTPIYHFVYGPLVLAALSIDSPDSPSLITYILSPVGYLAYGFTRSHSPPADLIYRLRGKGWRYDQGRRYWKHADGGQAFEPGNLRHYLLNLADWFGWFIPFYPMWSRKPLVKDEVISWESTSREEPVPPKFAMSEVNSPLTLDELSNLFKFHLVRASDGAEKELPVRTWQAPGKFRVIGPLPTAEQLENPENVLVHVEVRDRKTGEIMYCSP